MGNVEFPVEKSGFPEKRIFRSRFVTVGDIAYSFEPNELYDSRTVGEQSGEPAACPFSVSGV